MQLRDYLGGIAEAIREWTRTQLEVADTYKDGELVVYECPNHPEPIDLTEDDVVEGTPGHCPECDTPILEPPDADAPDIAEEQVAEDEPDLAEAVTPEPDEGPADAEDPDGEQDPEPTSPAPAPPKKKRRPFKPIPRHAWTPKPAPGSPMGRVGLAFAHHDVLTLKGGKRASRRVELAHCRTLDRVHSRLGGAAYSIGIAPSGRVYILRGFRVGAHTCRYNSISYAIVLFGNYEIQKMTRAARRAFRRTLRWMRRKGKLRRRYKLRGHRDVGACSGPTACPGKNVYRLLSKLKVRFRRRR